MPGTIIAVYNAKGGSTKTTSCASLSVALWELGQRPVLIVDADPNASLTMSFGINVAQHEKTLYEGLFGEGVTLRDTVRIVREGLHLIPSAQRLAAAEKLIATEEGGEVLLSHALRDLSPSYAFILIDCPPNLGKLNVSALVAASGVVVPVTAEFLSLGPLEKGMKAIENVRTRLNPALRIHGLLLTRYDRRTSHAREVEETLRGKHGGLVLDVVVPESVRFKEAPIGAMTILDYDPTHQGAESYRAVARELIKRTHETTEIERAAIG